MAMLLQVNDINFRKSRLKGTGQEERALMGFGTS